MFQRYLKKDKITEFAGFYHKNQVLGTALIIACLAFGGLPAFNIFVGEYLIYALLYSIHPIYALLTVFGSLLAFLYYFRLVYIIFGGREQPSIKPHLLVKVTAVLLSLAIIVLGVVPCTKCIKDMALFIIRSKKADFDATYDAIETALNELEGDNTEGMSEL